jgi:hypothetical protein
MMRKLISAAACAAALAWCVPASAQDRAYDLGPLWNISMIDVEDGQFENYMDWLNGRWKDNQAFAKKQGWLMDYYILANDDKRAGEPDLYLITRYADYPTTAEIKRRDAIMMKRAQSDAKTMDRESGERGKMRTQMGSMMLRELTQK